MIDWSAIQAITFDCYGTLIDWEQGITAALRPLLEARNARAFSDRELLEAYAHAEAREESQAYKPYRQILQAVTRSLATTFSATLLPADTHVLENSIAYWPAFPDTPAAMNQLSYRFQLIILSNIDRDLFEQTRPKLGANLTHIITAQDVRSYKPGPAHFEAALQKTNLAPSRICHVAQSLYHDISVARSLGFPTVWINRRGDRPGSGATPPASAKPDLEAPDLASLAKIAAPSNTTT